MAPVAPKGAPSIKTKDLSYAFPDGSSGLSDINIDLPGGARCLLIGGKKTHTSSVITRNAKSSEQMARARRLSSASSPANAWPQPAP